MSGRRLFFRISVLPSWVESVYISSSRIPPSTPPINVLCIAFLFGFRRSLFCHPILLAEPLFDCLKPAASLPVLSVPPPSSPSALSSPPLSRLPSHTPRRAPYMRP